ncbi:MAG: HEAT repeat domain-containing protein [Armatimonadetes bacterium]|nr:HEAT repeat domain-containing protein [Armatimonadota bacterium]
MEGRRRLLGYVAVVVVALVLVGWLTARYLVKGHLIRSLGSTDMQVRVDATQKLLDTEKLSDALPAQHIIVRSKTAEALGEIGTDEALDVLGEILADQEEAPRRWARRALVKQGMRAVPVLLSALSAGGGTTDEAIAALEEIGPQTAAPIRFLLSDGSSAEGAATALAKLGDTGVDALIRACYNTHGGLRVNALGKLGQEKIEAAVEPAMYNLLPIDGSEKGAAIKALGLIGDSRAVLAIIPFLQDKDNREGAVTALGQMGDFRAVEPILATMLETEKRYRNAAILALRRIGEPAFPALVRELRSDQVLLRQAAAEALVGSDSAGVNGALIVALKDYDDEVRASAALALGWKENVGAVPALIGSLSDSSWRVVDSAVSALGEIGLGATDTLLAALRSPESSLTVRYQVSRALSAMGRDAVPRLTAALSDGSPSVQMWSAVALGEIGDSRAVDALERLAEGADPEVQWVAQEQLRRLTSLAGT